MAAGRALSSADRWKSFMNKRSVLGVALLMIVIIFCVNYTAVFDRKLDPNGDNISYYSLAQALSEGKGYTNIMAFTETPHTHFPPGYSVFMAALMTLFPDNIVAMKVANGILLLLSVLLLFFLIRYFTDKNTLVALLVCLLCCMQKDVLRFATIMMSETLYMFLSLTIIALALWVDHLGDKWMTDKAAAKTKTRYVLGLVLLIALVGYVYFVRTISLSIMLASMLWFLFIGIRAFSRWMKARNSKAGSLSEGSMSRASFQSFLGKILVALLLLCVIVGVRSAWQARQYRCGKTGAEYITEFSKKGGGETMSGWADWSERIQNNTSNYITKWIPEMVYGKAYDVSEKSTFKDWMLGLLIVFLMVSALLKIRKAALLLFLYMAATMGALLLFPEQFQGSRYCIAVIPLFIFLNIYGMYALPSLLFRKKDTATAASLLVILVVLIVMMPVYSTGQKEFREMAKMPSWLKSRDVNYTNYLKTAQWCGRHLPKDARMVCRKPEIYYMYSGYRKATAFPQYATPEEILAHLDKVKATHIIIDNWFRHAYITLYPTVQKYPDKFKAVQQVGTVNQAYQLLPVFVLEYHADGIKNNLPAGN